MNLVYLPLFVFFPFMTGLCFIRYLTCQPVRMDNYLFLTCLFFFITLLLFLDYLRKAHSILIPLSLSVIVFASGYMLSLYAFMNTAENRVLPQLTRIPGERGLGHTAVIVLAHGEPETYDAGAWLRQMKEFDEQRIRFIPYPFRPFFFKSLRDKYLLVGKSGHNAECLQIKEQLKAEYRLKGDNNTRFYISYLENEPRPDAAVIQALNEGADNIILCNIFLTISNHTQEAIDLIKPIGLEALGVKIRFTKPLYDSDILQQLYTDALNRDSRNTCKQNTGVILIGHGQPTEWDKDFPSETLQEISFRKDILKKFELGGYSPDNLKLAWMEFREPTPSKAIEELVKNGAEVIFYFSTIIGSESIHAKYDIPSLVNSTKVTEGVKLIQLTAFEDKSGIVEALMERIEESKKLLQ